MGRSMARRGGYTMPKGSGQSASNPPKHSKGNIVNAQGTHVNKSDNAHGRGPLGGARGKSKSGKMGSKNSGPHGYS